MYENETNKEKLDRLMNGLLMAVDGYITAKDENQSERSQQINYLAMKGCFKDVINQMKIIDASNTPGKIIKFPKF